MDNQEQNNVQENVKLSEQELQELKTKANANDLEATCKLADYYFGLVSKKQSDIEAGALCFKYSQKAVQMGNPAGYYPLAILCNAGVGTKQSNADAYQYATRYLDECGDGAPATNRAIIKYMISEALAYGKGTQKNVPLAYEYICESIETDKNEETIAFKESLERAYPFDEKGEINIKARGRSGLTTFLIVLGVLGSIWGFVFPNMVSDAGAMFGGAPFFIGMAINMAMYGGMLFWLKPTGWVMLAQWVLSPLFLWGFFAGMTASLDNGENMSVWSQFCFSQFANIPLNTLILIMLQRRKPGCALPWCSVTGMRDDGRNMFARVKDFFMAYGEGEEYRRHSDASERFAVCCKVVTGLVAVVGIYLGYELLTDDSYSWGVDIEWAVWKSPKLWGALSVLGFFLQFFDWQHFSYKTINIYKDEYGNEIKRERDRDVLTEVEGSFLYPLLMHLLVIPAGYGALLYYLIMGIFALLGVLVPYFVTAIFIVLAWPFYKVSQHFIARRFRYLLLVVAVMITILLMTLIGGIAIEAFASTSDKPKTEEFFAGSEADKAEGGSKESYADETASCPEEIFCDADLENEEETTESEAEPETAGMIDEELTQEIMEDMSLDEQEDIMANEETATTDDRIYEVVEQTAQFPGGDDACYKWLSEHIKYPRNCMEEGVQGRVVMNFVVNKDGSIVDVKISRSPDPRLSEEAVRVVNLMPKWKPAMQDGKAVRSRFALPVMFRLN